MNKMDRTSNVTVINDSNKLGRGIYNMDILKLLEDYVDYRRKKGIHDNTIDIELKYINKFNQSVLAGINEDAENPFSRITGKDVENFFGKEREVLSARTVYRKITIITHYFDFLSHKGLVIIDFMPKFRRRFQKLDWTTPGLNVNYLDLLEKEKSILEQDAINLMPRLIYLLLMYGLELKDIMNLTVEDVKVGENTKEIYLFVNNPSTSTDRIIHLQQDIEYRILKSAYEVAMEKGAKYLVHTKSGDRYGMYNPSNLPDMMKPINEIIGYSLNSSKQTMYAFVYYLIKIKNCSIEQVSEILGKPLKVTAKLVKTTLDRVE